MRKNPNLQYSSNSSFPEKFVFLNFRLSFQLVNACYEMNIPHNIMICYGKAQSQINIKDTDGYIRFILFPRKPVTGKQCSKVVKNITQHLLQFTGFKELYDSGSRPPVFCAACELGGCVTLLGNTHSPLS